MPFNPERLPQYKPEQPERDNTGAGLGLHLIRSVMDETKFIRHGRQGQEIQLTKFLKNKRIDQLLSRQVGNEPNREPASSSIDLQSVDYSIRPMRPEEAVEVAKCAYKCYGYTYEDYVYYPERLTAMNEDGYLYSVVAVSGENRILGHAALKFLHPGAVIAESGVAFVYPEYRRLGLFGEFNTFFINHAREMGLSGLYGRAVTSHIASQRMAAGHGYKDCGLFLGIFFGDVDFKKIGNKAGQRESALLSFLNLENSEPRNIHVPDHYQSIVSDLFRALGLPIRFANGHADNERSHMEVVVDSALNIAEMTVHKSGLGLSEEIRFKHHELCLKRIDVIHLVLSLEDPQTGSLIRDCEALGFFFAGILPYGLNGRHAITLQYLNNVMIDVDKLKLFSPEAIKILEYIKTTGKI